MISANLLLISFLIASSRSSSFVFLGVFLEVLALPSEIAVDDLFLVSGISYYLDSSASLSSADSWLPFSVFSS